MINLSLWYKRLFKRLAIICLLAVSLFMVSGCTSLFGVKRKVNVPPLLGPVYASTTLAFDIGVYLVVVGLVFMVFEAFGDDDPEAEADGTVAQ